MARLGTLALVILSSLGGASGQFLRGSGSSYSYFGSFSLFSGDDGSLHHQLHTVKQETLRDDDGHRIKSTRSDIACADGDCQKSMTVMRPAASLFQGQWMTSPMLLRLRSAWASSPVVVQSQIAQPQAVVPLVATPQTGIVMVSPKRRIPKSIDVLLRHIVGPAESPDTRSAALPPALEAPQPNFVKGWEEEFFIGLTAAATTLIATMLILYKLRFANRASARTISELAEPLAASASVAPEARKGGIAGPFRIPMSPEAVAAKSTQAYLSRLYVEATATAKGLEAKASFVYLCDVYERASRP